MIIGVFRMVIVIRICIKIWFVLCFMLILKIQKAMLNYYPLEIMICINSQIHILSKGRLLIDVVDKKLK